VTLSAGLAGTAGDATHQVLTTGHVDLTQALTVGGVSAATGGVARFGGGVLGGALASRAQSATEATPAILDTNAVFAFNKASALLKPGEVPVVTGTTRAELANVVARSDGMFMPRVANSLDTIQDVMDVDTRINIRGALAGLRPGQPGLFGDGSIGATVLATGSPFITGDRALAQVLSGMGADVRLFAP